MKKTKNITRKLVVSTTVLSLSTSFYACSSSKNNTGIRNQYVSFDECKKDYEPKDCTYNEATKTYYGPFYEETSRGTNLSGRTSIGRPYGMSNTASHVVNSLGTAMAVGAAVYAIQNNKFGSFSRSGFGSTSKSMSSIGT
ncbi:MAG: hypothetical protein U0457_00140 [Candidatus Sericytochromatia bacterium]